MKPIRFLSVLVVLTTSGLPASALAENRMAGRDNAPPALRHMEASSTPVSARARSVDMNLIESIGLLSSPRDGSLGIDVWYGSDRAFINQYLPQLPGLASYRTLQALQRRLLLTEADPSFFNRASAPPPGSDLLTLRLAKLKDMGLFNEASELYRRLIVEPYHPDLAYHGVTSLMLADRGPLACLEVKAQMQRFGNHPHWQTLHGICDLMLDRIQPSGDQDANLVLAATGSDILGALANRRNYQLNPTSQQAFDQLSEVERAALRINGALHYDRFAFQADGPTSPVAIGMLVNAKNLPGDLDFLALAESVRIGNHSKDALTRAYTNNDAAASGWRELIRLYERAGNAARGSEQSAILTEALDLERKYGTYALLPFGRLLAQSDSDHIAPHNTDTAIRVMLLAGYEVPASWLNRFAQQLAANDRSPNQLLLLFAAGLTTNLSAESQPAFSTMQDLFKSLNPRHRAIISASYEKLDNRKKFHNDAQQSGYEKQAGLTSGDDYVMPLSSLAATLSRAYSQKRLGEAILLSSIVMKDTTPDSLNPALIGEILGGMRTVGLTKEAQALAIEVILGMSK